MDRNCYRCGSAIEDKAPFCPNCRAPQIRVTAAEESTPVVLTGHTPVTAEATTGYSGSHTGGIQWRVYSRAALPLAALTGFVAAMFFPAVIVAFPLGFRRTLSQYRPFHSGPLTSRQGAHLGAFMALLSFAASLVFYVPTIVLGHDTLVARIREMAAQYPDPQAQQMVLWFTTRPGFVILSAIVLAFVLLILLLVGLLCGALMTGQSEDRA